MIKTLIFYARSTTRRFKKNQNTRFYGAFLRYLSFSGQIQRKDYNLLKEYLPNKREYKENSRQHDIEEV